MPGVGFEPTISVGEQPKTSALDRAATGTGQFNMYSVETGDGSEHLKYICIMYYIIIVLFKCGPLPGGM